MGKIIDDGLQSLKFQILDLHLMQHNIYVAPMRRRLITFKEQMEVHLQRTRSKFQKWRKLSEEQIRKQTKKNEDNISELWENCLSLISEIASAKVFVSQAKQNEQINSSEALIYEKQIQGHENFAKLIKESIKLVNKQEEFQGRIKQKLKKEGILNIYNFLPKGYKQQKDQAEKLLNQYVKEEREETFFKFKSTLENVKILVRDELKDKKSEQIKGKLKKDVQFWLKKLRHQGQKKISLDQYWVEIENLFK